MQIHVDCTGPGFVWTISGVPAMPHGYLPVPLKAVKMPPNVEVEVT